MAKEKLKTLNLQGEMEEVYAASSLVTFTPSIPYLTALPEYASMVGHGEVIEIIAKQAIMLSNKLYFLGGIYRTVLDALIFLSCGTVHIKTGNKKVDKYIKYWLRHVNRDNPRTIRGHRKLVEALIREYIVCGNDFPYEKWQTDDRAGKDVFLPMNILMLNPMMIWMRLENSYYEHIQFANMMYNTGSGGVTPDPKGMITIRTSNMQRLALGGRDYLLWGLPYGARVFGDLARKERARMLDDSIAQSILNDVTIFSFYDDKTGAIGKQASMDKFKKNLDGTGVGMPVKNLFWGGPIKILKTGPSGEILKYQERFHQIDEDTYNSFGFPRFLISGKFEGGSSAAETALNHLKSVIRNIRENVSDWFRCRVEKMMEVNGDEADYVDVSMSMTDLEDNAVFLAKIKTMRDSGIISNETVADTYDFNARMEEYIMAEEYEKQLEDEYRFGKPAAVPFQGIAGAQGGPAGDKTNGRPSKDNPSSVLKSDSVSKTKNKITEKKRVKASVNDIVDVYAASLLENLKLDYLGLEDKIYMPLTTACHIAEKIGSEMNTDSVPGDVLKQTMLQEANEYSLDVQQLIITDSIDERQILARTKVLKENLVKKYYDLTAKYSKSEA